MEDSVERPSCARGDLTNKATSVSAPEKLEANDVSRAHGPQEAPLASDVVPTSFCKMANVSKRAQRALPLSGLTSKKEESAKNR